MSRLLLLLAVIALVVWLLKSYAKQSTSTTQASAAEDMVRCAQCGVHLPKSESITSAGKFFCSDAHRLEHGA